MDGVTVGEQLPWPSSDMGGGGGGSLDEAFEDSLGDFEEAVAGGASGGSGEYPVAMTGLAGLAIIASGSTPTRGPHAKDVRMAVRYVLSQQQPSGLFAATSEEPRSMYGHGFGMLFLARKKAPTLEQLALKLDIPAAALIETTRQYNRAQRDGQDDPLSGRSSR